MPNTYAALLKSIIDATAFAHKAENRKQIAAAIAPANYLNQPETVLEQILTGTYADGLGGVKRDPERIDFDPFPWQSFAIWILTQMKEVGLTPPTTSTKSFKVMGKEFDPGKPDEYVNSFAIKRG
jgi:nitrate/nitrite transport system substrate-binding protein